jgi:DNA-binding SARP family transcriptional activator/LysM repeat protein
MIRLMAAIRTTITVVTLLAAVPLLLFAIGGSPLPDRVPSSLQIQNWLDDPMQPQYVAATVKAGAWLIWALLVAAVLGVMGARVRRWRWARLTIYLPGPVQGLAATLLGAATVTTAVGVPQPQAAIPVAAQDSVPPGPQAMVNAATAATVSVHRDEHRTEQSSSTVTVRRGDTLWGIAADRLGSAQRWKQIYRLNTDRYPRMHGGDHIEPGWTLTLPTRATKPAPEPTSPATANPGPASTSAHPSPAPSPAGERDGVVEPSAPTRTPSSVSSAGAAASQSQVDQGRSPRTGVSLASGSWLDIGLATAIAAAVTLVWAHRRRRYTSRPLTPDLLLDDPDLAPMPSVVTEIRRRLRGSPEPTDADAVVRSSAPASTTAAHALRPSDSSSVDRALGTEESTEVDDSASPAATDGEEAEDDKSSRSAGALAQDRPVVPALTNPAPVVWPSSGLGLIGFGAEPAARGFLAAALADSDRHAPPGQVVLPSTTAATLLGAAAVALPRTPRLIVADDLDDALTLLEQEILHRSRLVYAHEVDTVAAMRAADPYEEPTPPLLLIADAASNHERTRIAALLAQGQRLDVHGVLLGAWPAGDTVIVDSDGTTAPGDSGRHGQHPADVGRFAVLTPTETVAVITTLAEAHTGLPQPPPPIEAAPPRQNAAEPAVDAGGVVLSLDDAGRVLAALGELGDATAAAIAAHLDLPYPAATAKLVQWEHTGHAETTRTDTVQTLWRLTDTGRHALGTPATEPAASTPADPVADGDLQGAVPQTGEGQAPTDGRYAEIGTVLQWPDPETTFTSKPPPSDAGDDDTEKPGHVEVTVFGEAGIVATDPDRRPRRKAVELLVYLAVHDGSATVEAILDDLMPEAPASKAPERLHTYVSDLRSVMRRIGGPGTYLTHPHQRYTLNPDGVDVDLWRMRAAIREAHQAEDPRQRIDALQQAVDAYRGPLADGADYQWAESYREAIRQQALDAHLALADALTGDPAAQARILEAAIGHSPYSEHLYQQAMRARAALGHLDAIRTLRRALDRALADIDAEPSDDTITLADQLIADLQRPGQCGDIEATSGTN